MSDMPRFKALLARVAEGKALGEDEAQEGFEIMAHIRISVLVDEKRA